MFSKIASVVFMEFRREPGASLDACITSHHSTVTFFRVDPSSNFVV